MVEIAVASVVLLLAIGGLSSAVVSSLRLADSNEQAAAATDAALQMAERLRSAPFEQVFAIYNGVADDDPADTTVTPGNTFSVPGLTPDPDDPDGMVGEVVFPTVAVPGVGLALREDVQDSSLGMPRDLNADGEIDQLDHSGDYVLLPVTIRLAWADASGRRSMEFDLLLVD